MGPMEVNRGKNWTKAVAKGNQKKSHKEPEGHQIRIEGTETSYTVSKGNLNELMLARLWGMSSYATKQIR